MIRIVNYVKYKNTRDANKNPTGNATAPLLTYPNQPNHTNPPISPKGFDDFWKAYPKKVGKGAALKAWDKANLNGKVQIVLDAVARQKTWHQWQKERGQYIPNPATWINQGRWEDQPVEEQGEERTGVWAKKFTPEVN